MEKALALYNAAAGNPLIVMAASLAVQNRLLLLHWAVLGILKVSWLRRIMLGNADEVLASVDAFRAELKADLDEAKAADAAKAAATVPALIVAAPVVPPKA